MKQILSAFALALAFTPIALGQAVEKHEMSLYPSTDIMLIRLRDING